MKTKFFALATLLALTLFNLQAQVEKNKLFVAGSFRIELNAGGENDKYGDIEDKYSYFDFDFQPKIGYTVIDNLPIGLYMDVDYYREKAKDDNDKYKETTVSVGPFIRYYFLKDKKFKPFAEGLIGFGFYRAADKTEADNDWNVFDKEGYFTYRIGGGASYFFNDYIAADLFMGFNHEGWTVMDESVEDRSSDTKYLYNEFLMQIGIVVMLPL